ncbi:PAS domain S-box protein [Streptomyces tailanensis]|uniref:PAS domain S-box protein n=1 Tax=Streptomyces tailanensis TaxID=2569858 RepID=UPI00122DE8C8|nr:PAS domain S-box protein [Streptomyces tailanensis]
MNHRIPVMVADNDAEVREALADLVESHPAFQLVGLAVDHAQTVSVVGQTHPVVLILDVQMPKGDAPTTVRTLRERAPDTRILALSAYADRETVTDVLVAGAVGYLVKGAPAEEILEAVTRAARGQFSMSAELAEACLEPLRRVPRPSVPGAATAPVRIDEKACLDVLEQAPCGVLVIGAQDRVEVANAHARHMFGYSAAELRGKRLRDLLPEHPSAGVDTGELIAPVTPGLRRNGSEFPVRISGGRLRGGRPRHVVYVTVLGEAGVTGDRLRQLVESSPDAMLVLDAEGRIRQASPRAETLFGYSHERLLGTLIEVLLPDQPLTISLSDWTDPRQEPTGHSVELVGRRQDSKQFPVDVSVSPLRTAEGVFAVLTVRDITEVQRAQFVLERSLELLEGTDRDRQALLSHLIHAQEEERRRIAADIHDDTIQVITAAGLRLQQLRRRLTDPKDAQVMDRLDETLKLSLSRLRQLIFDLRPSALEHGSLATALQTFLDRMRAETGTHYRFEDRLEATLPVETMVLVYRTAQEALMNVLKHARAKTVRVQLLGVEDGCLMRIVDDGVGYDPLEVESRPGHLGLTLIHERAQMAGGWSRVESEPGAGTTVEFWVPIEEAPSPSTESGTEENGPSAPKDTGP